MICQQSIVTCDLSFLKIFHFQTLGLLALIEQKEGGIKFPRPQALATGPQAFKPCKL